MPLHIDPIRDRRSTRSSTWRAGVTACLLAMALAPAIATADQPKGNTEPPPSTSICNDPYLAQPFLPLGDNHDYMLPAGETPGGFNGDGWTLIGGAGVVQVADDSGAKHTVLDLPSGATATTPAMCVTADYPTARAMVRNVRGAEGVFFYVAYGGTSSWDKPRNTGQFHGQQNRWSLSDRINLQPDHKPGWQIVDFTFVAGGTSSDFQVYDFYVDPYAKR